MKITDVKAYLIRTKFTPEWPNVQSQINPLMYYDEYKDTMTRIPVSRHTRQPEPGILKKIILAIETDAGITGIHTPVEQDGQVEYALGFKQLLIGKDPMATRTIWDMMDRASLHGRVGSIKAAFAAIDNALWDLKGKIAGQPVYKLLGGGRNMFEPYFTTVGAPAGDLEAVKRIALDIKAQGINGQKWFFKYSPSHGYEGMHKNVELAYTLRETLGDDYEIAFDAWASWDLTYCLEIFPELEGMRPKWIEEPLRADRIETYKMLRSRTNLQISLGEKLYNRFEAHEFLKERLIDIYQPEPEISGGITETLRIGELCELYGVKFVPHGMSLIPNLSISSVMPPDITPNFEFHARAIEANIWLLKNAPRIENGWVKLPDTPGMFELDEEKFLSKEEIK